MGKNQQPIDKASPDGILLIDKPSGVTSHDVVQKIRFFLQTHSIGHTGTLDPLATGLLVLCVGKATKFVKFLTNHDKSYQADILLGIQTDTDDITGKVLKKTDPSQLSDEKIQSVIHRFYGNMKQIPPAYSAIKVDGKKLYQYARNEQQIPIVEPREIEIKSISDFSIVRSTTDITLKMTLLVSKGTYIRAIARDIGECLHVGGCLKQLTRMQVGEFNLKDAQSLDEIERGNPQFLNPLSFLGFPRITVDDVWGKKVMNGVKMPIAMFQEITPTIIESREGDVLAVYEPDENQTYMRMSVKIA
ncbi:MAG: tRNA pseudouridine(55) synthase TruB [Candidatus Izemoplasmatales bacterium]|nr:tRNA pseudouridine(55) synthase TruB [Candidatus Izemoplasmatales bacterium]